MFRRNRKQDDAVQLYALEHERVKVNLEAQRDEIWNQLVAAVSESERRLAEMKRDRDYWREQAEGGKL